MAQAKFYFWCDLETTGLDQVHDPIIEIGVVITEIAPPCVELASYTVNVLPSPNDEWKDRMDSYVLEMHTINGLLSDIESDSKPLREAEIEIINLLSTFGRPHNFMLAGSGVSHFDRRFIASQMPGLDRWIQYPCLDVGTVRRGLSFCGRKDLTSFGETFEGGDKPHRALADVRDHLNEWRNYAAIIQQIERTDDGPE